MSPIEGKPVSASMITNYMIQIVPDDLNPNGTVVGGKLMQVVDTLAADVAKRHAGCYCTTSGIDSVRFFNPAQHGDLLIAKASVNRVWETSMEIGVKVISEDFRTLEQKDILSAYITFIAMDHQSNLTEIIPVIPEKEKEKSRFAAAEKRRIMRVAAV